MYLIRRQPKSQFAYIRPGASDIVDAVEIMSAVLGSAVLLAMFGMVAGRSWLDRQEAKQIEQQASADVVQVS
jgi:hypothetical protein